MVTESFGPLAVDSYHYNTHIEEVPFKHPGSLERLTKLQAGLPGLILDIYSQFPDPKSTHRIWFIGSNLWWQTGRNSSKGFGIGSGVGAETPDEAANLFFKNLEFVGIENNRVLDLKTKRDAVLKTRPALWQVQKDDAGNFVFIAAHPPQTVLKSAVTRFRNAFHPQGPN